MSKDWPASKVVMRSVSDLIQYVNNSRIHNDVNLYLTAGSVGNLFFQSGNIMLA